MDNKSGPIPCPIEERFWSKVCYGTGNECWIWNAGKYKTGYGCFTIKKNGKWVNTRAHRFAYELIVGAIPEGLELDHLCRNHACVNPKHLEAVTHQENCRRGELGFKFAELQRQKTHCPRGHPYNLLNTYIKKDGARMCKACRTINQRKRRANLQVNFHNLH